MIKYVIIGIGMGIAFTAWVVIALLEGTVNVNMSGMHMDYTAVNRSDTPGKYWAAMSGLTFVVVVYWLCLVWFLRRLRTFKLKSDAS
jgi:ABC-type enterobactin transport system permease subunit